MEGVQIGGVVVEASSREVQILGEAWQTDRVYPAIDEEALTTCSNPVGFGFADARHCLVTPLLFVITIG